jgi:AcrR family transcriptional regulator
MTKKLDLRKRPKQGRSQQTMECILQGAALILEKDGLNGFNTNAIAKKAGVSVGSLYQYFPSKESILVALIEEYFIKQDKELIKFMDELDINLPANTQIELSIRKLYEILYSQPQISRLLLQQADSYKVKNKIRRLDKKFVQNLHTFITTIKPKVSLEQVGIMVAAVKGINDMVFSNQLPLSRERLEEVAIDLAIHIIGN